jgi:hypothetical protein
MKLRKLAKSPSYVFFALLLTSIAIFLAHYALVGNAVWGDGRYYYAYTRSLVIDQDLDFSNERLVDPFYFDNIKTPIGRVGNKYSIGTPLFWLPAFLTAHLFSLLGSVLGLPLIPDGYSHLYRIFIGLNSVAFTLIGLAFSFLVARRLTTTRVALLATLTIAVGSHLFYYLAVDPINSHPPSMFTAGLLVWYWFTHARHQLNFRRALVLGLLTGTVTLIRNHDVIYALPILFWIITTSTSLRSKIAYTTAYICGAASVFTIQLMVWYRLYGTLTSPYYLLGESFDLTRLKLLPVLFSLNNGLFIYAPILLLSLYGLIKSAQKSSRLAQAGIILFTLQALILAGWSGWWGGESFGGRMFLSLTPSFILGLAYTYHRLKSRLSVFISFGSIILTQVLILRFLLMS